MNVAVDARQLETPGIGRYVSELLPRLQIDGMLYALAPPDADIPENCRHLEVTAPPFSISEQFVLPWALRELDVDLFHSPQFNIPLAWRGPQVTTIHDCAYDVFPEEFGDRGRVARLYYRHMMRTAVRRSDHVITVSDSTQDDLVELYGLDREKATTIHHGVAPRFFDPPDVALPADVPENFLLYVGSARPRKNLPRLFDAYQLVRDRREDPPALVLAGEFERRFIDLPTVLTERSLTPYVHHVGYVSDETLRRLYADAVAFVFPSLYEGFGFPVLEAMAAATPVVTSHRSALPEVVGDAAVIVDPMSPRAIADEIARLLRQPESRENLAQDGTERAREFSWDSTAERTAAVYRART